jgi:hypothetical protein
MVLMRSHYRTIEQHRDAIAVFIGHKSFSARRH